jgi:hypothetical protein
MIVPSKTDYAKIQQNVKVATSSNDIVNKICQNTCMGNCNAPVVGNYINVSARVLN